MLSYFVTAGAGILLCRTSISLKLIDSGVGFVFMHYAVEVPKGRGGDLMLKAMGGYFETYWSVNPHWTAEIKSLPEHPITRGVKPFTQDDEWYFHMRFQPKGVTPILSAHPPKSTMDRKDGPHSNNKHVRKSMAEGQIQHIGWAYERPNGKGRVLVLPELTLTTLGLVMIGEPLS